MCTIFLKRLLIPIRDWQDHKFAQAGVGVCYSADAPRLFSPPSACFSCYFISVLFIAPAFVLDAV